MYALTFAPLAATPELIATIERLGPFGTGNSEPRFAIANARLLFADTVGDRHLRCVLGDAVGKARVKSILFRAFETPLGQALVKAKGSMVHVAGHLRADRWQGRDDAQLIVDDAASVSGPERGN